MVMAQYLFADDGASATIEEAPPAAELCLVSGGGNAELTTDYDLKGFVDSVDSPEDRRSSSLDAGENGEEAPRNGCLETQERPPEPTGNGGEGVEAKRMRKDLEIEDKDGEVGLGVMNSESVCGNKGKELVRRYSMSELEALRFVGTGEQRLKWKEVYQKLGSIVAQEYDGLWASNPQKKKRGGKKKEKETPLIMGEMSAMKAGNNCKFMCIGGWLKAKNKIQFGIIHIVNNRVLMCREIIAYVATDTIIMFWT